MEFNGPKVVKIKRVPRPGYFNLVSYPRSVTTLSCQIAKNGYNTGLTKDEETFYESKLGLKAGELGKNSKWWGDVFNVDHAIRLKNDKSNELITEGDNWINQLKYKVLLAHSDVAASELERMKPGILFFIDDEETKAKAELESINFEFEGMKLIYEMSPEKRKAALRLFGKKGVDAISEKMSMSQLMQECKKDPKQFFNIMTDKELEMRGWISELVEKNILHRKGTDYIYNEDTIGGNIEECISYFKEHQDVKLTLTTKSKKIKI